MLFNVGNKEKWSIQDRKWSPEEFNRPEYIQALEKDFLAAFGEAWTKKFLSKDFNIHIKCLQQLKNLKDADLSHFVQVLDIIFKWIFVKSFESSNTTFLNQVLTFLEELLENLVESQYQLMEGEGHILITMLVEKTGLNNTTLQEQVVKILKFIGFSRDLFSIT